MFILYRKVISMNIKNITISSDDKMRTMGLEPTRAYAHMTLNHACLPFQHVRNNS